ncbi:MAG: hypothetical protein AAFU53_08685 [Cyanobacteria bacterium J06632_3]
MTSNFPRYAGLAEAIVATCQAWCQAESYSDPFCQDGEWWAFPPEGAMPVRVKTVMGKASCCWVQINNVTMALFPDGTLARDTDFCADKSAFL